MKTSVFREMLKLCIGLALPTTIAVLLSPPASANNEKILYSFCSQGGNSCGDGAEPFGDKLVFDTAGNLYGTVYAAGPLQQGEVFRLSHRGVLRVPLPFPDQYGQGEPMGGVIMDDAGNLYGATEDHVFKLSPDGKETLLHLFSGENGDGALMGSGLYRDRKGNLYGTTASGGASFYGTVFQISPKGKERILHSFIGTDGASPEATPVMDRGGNLYATAAGGGSSNCTAGCGTIYKIAKDGTFKVLYAFTGSNDGAHPLIGLALDRMGNLYGTANNGGDFDCGTVFKITPDGSETTLHVFTFADDSLDGCNPISQPIFDTKGNLYGTTSGGGSFGTGTVFTIAPNGKEKILYTFSSAPDGAQPDGTLIMDEHENLYGTTRKGGAFGWGTVYEISHKE